MPGRQYTKHIAKTFKSAGDLSAAALRYTFVKISAAYTATTCVADEYAVGVQQNLPDAAGKAMNVALCGSGGGTKLRIGALVAAGAPLMPTTGGLAITATTGKSFYAIAVDGGTNSGEVIEAILHSGQVQG